MKRIMNAELEGRRPVGRPRTRWKDVLRRDLQSSGLTLEQAAEEAVTVRRGKTSYDSSQGCTFAWPAKAFGSWKYRGDK